jgi:hypothetical protein
MRDVGCPVITARPADIVVGVPGDVDARHAATGL